MKHRADISPKKQARLMSSRRKGMHQRWCPGFSRSGSRQGFALLEIILALGLFSLVAVGLTRALDMIAQTSRQARQEAQVLRVLESVLAEVSHQPELKPATVTFPKSADHVEARATISKAELITKDKTKLDHIFHIQAEAWIEDGRKKALKRQMQTYVYSPTSP